jgi:lipopolysaccharide export system protein LptA
LSWSRYRRAAAAGAGLCLGLALGASAAPAVKPVATGAAKPDAGSRDPVDITADHGELFQDERRLVYTGNVEAIWGQDRLRTPQLTIFFTKHDPAAPTPKAAAPPPGGAAGSTFGKIDRMEADGTVYFTTPTQNAKGDHGTYLAAPDTITLLGDVVLVQDKNVSTGDKLVIDRKTDHSTLYANGGAAPSAGPHRVRGVFYQDQNNAAPSSTAPSPLKPSGPAANRPAPRP